MTRRCRSVSPELSARIPGGRPGSERAGREGTEPSGSVVSFIACTGSSRFWERSWAVMMASSAVVVTSAPLEKFSPWLDNGSGFRKVAPNTRSSEKLQNASPERMVGCRSGARTCMAIRSITVPGFIAASRPGCGRCGESRVFFTLSLRGPEFRWRRACRTLGPVRRGWRRRDTRSGENGAKPQI